MWDIFTDLASGRGVAKENNQTLYVLTVIHIPRSLLALMVGGCLAVPRVAYQGLLHDPMVSPGIFGVASGVSTGAILYLPVGVPLWVTWGMAFAFDLGVVTMVLLLE